ncbi:MAG: hypothetical protein AAGI50_18555 [Pseudomonadota bacterium]
MSMAFAIILAAGIAIMAISAWYLGAEHPRTRASARVGLVLGGTTVFIASLLYASILVAVLVVLLPVALFVAWWSGLWS